MYTWIVKTLPLLLLVLGLISFFLSTLPDGGFVKGLFQGAGVALFAFGAYFLFLTARRRGGHSAASMWRPSEDARSGDRG